jgi:hypothetical protein
LPSNGPGTWWSAARLAADEPRGHDLEEQLGALEVLEDALAERTQADVVGLVVGQQRLGCARDEHLAAVSRRTDAGRAVHSEPDVAVVGDGGLGGVQAHPHPQGRARRPAVCGEGALSVHRGDDGLARSPEDDEQAVALRVDLAAAVPLEGLAQDPPVVRHRIGERVAETSQEPRGALDVREEQGDCSGRKLAHGLLDATGDIRFRHGAAPGHRRVHPCMERGREPAVGDRRAQRRVARR